MNEWGSRMIGMAGLAPGKRLRGETGSDLRFHRSAYSIRRKRKKRRTVMDSSLSLFMTILRL